MTNKRPNTALIPRPRPRLTSLVSRPCSDKIRCSKSMLNEFYETRTSLNADTVYLRNRPSPPPHMPRFSTPHATPSQTFRINSNHHPCVAKGRPHLAPLLTGTSSAFSRRRSRRQSLYSQKQNEDCEFGEVMFLKNKLGFTLPSTEDILKSEKTKTITRNLLLQKIAQGHVGTMPNVRRIIYSSQNNVTNKPKILNSEYGTQDRSKSVTSIPSYEHSSLLNEAASERFLPSASSERMFEHKRRHTVSYINMKMQSLEQLDQRFKQPSQKIVCYADGKVVTYTAEDLEAYEEDDLELLRSVRKHLYKDKVKVVELSKQRIQEIEKKIDQKSFVAPSEDDDSSFFKQSRFSYLTGLM